MLVVSHFERLFKSTYVQPGGDHVVPSQDGSGHQDDMKHAYSLGIPTWTFMAATGQGSRYPTYYMDTFSFYELLKTFFFPLGGSEWSIRIASH